MALFQRNNKTTEDPKEMDSYVDNLVSDNDPDINLEIESHFATSSRPNYRIEDAVNLMRRLPEGNSEVVINVVKETLKSASIDVEQIIQDAESKTTKIELDIHSLSMEISALEEQVKDKKAGIEAAQKSLSETQRVKVLLEKSQKFVSENKSINVVQNHTDQKDKQANIDTNSAPVSDLTASNF